MMGALLAPVAASAVAWEFVGNHDGTRVWRKQVPGSSKLAFRGVKVANVETGRVMAVFADPKLRKHWVAKWKDDRELDRKGELERVFWIRFELPWPVSDRDYVLHTKAEIDPVKHVVTANLKSTHHAKKPEDDCCVRGQLHGTYYKFEALKGGKTKMTVEVHTDPRGNLPAWLVNLIQKKWPSKTLNALAKAARRPGLKVNPIFATWHN